MNVFQRWIAPLLAMLLMVASVWAQTAPYSSTPIQAVPPNIATRDFPAMMMLAASRDHTLFGPMYTDYEDLTGSGRIDPTFRPDFSYYGYFDPRKCYRHDGDKFVPEAFRDDVNWCKLVAAARWSGNFLNWATMTRIDVVRKMLYGGFRQEDTPTSTVLQLAQLGTDAHAFAKYYRGGDIDKYTPFSTDDLKVGGVYAGLTTCAMSIPKPTDAATDVPILRMVKGNYLLWSTTAKKVCRWRPYKDTANAANADYWFGGKLVKYFERDAAIPKSDLEGTPQHALIAPFNDADDLPRNIGSNDIPIRVQACASVALMGTENCKRFEYRDGAEIKTALKPSGILLDYGFASSATDSARAEFGLVSGSYDSNLSGGVLRKNIGNLNDEVNADGTFCHNSAKPCGGGIIKSYDAFRLYNAGAKSYAEGAFNWVMPESLLNKQFPSWGNPIGEMLVDALSYYAHKGSAVASGTIDSGLGLPNVLSADLLDPLNDAALVSGARGLTRGQVYGKSICRPMNMLAISSSAVSYDLDEAPSSDKDLPIRGLDTLASFTDMVGVQEGINDTIRAVADVRGGWGQNCSGKKVSKLSLVSGICPEAPATKGSYLSAGAALYGNTRAIRGTEGTSKDIPGFSSKPLPSDLPGYALRVKTLAAAMGGGVARIEVVDPSSGAKVYITPASIWDLNGRSTSGDKWMPGAMLTIKLLNSVTNAGKTIAASYVVTWNDAQFGGDYDMDIVGYISYAITGGGVKVTTDILNVDGGLPGSHGFSVTGAVENAGTYITHGSHAINFGDCSLVAPGTPSVLSMQDYNLRCRYDDAGMPTTAAGGGFDGWAWSTKYEGRTVDFSGVETSSTRFFKFNASNTGSVLNDPLWYAAKYGSFTTGEDKFSAAFTGKLPDAASTAEGYFLARDPAKLEAGLRKALDKILAAGNSTPAVSTAQLISTSLKYVAEFDAKAHTGTVKAYEFSSEGFKKDPKFELGEKLTDASRPTAEHPDGVRQVITNVGLVGWPLNVASLDADAPGALADVRTALSADAGTDSWKDLVAYARGGIATVDLRKQPTNVLGPIVNAAPWLQRGALLRTTDVDLPSGWASYRDFAMTRSKGGYPSLLWVASDDSMLHAFHATTGEPWMSYLPSPLLGGLRAASRESTKSITATMDGSPFTADVHLPDSGKGAWATYLFSSLGRGGRAVFALDVTNTSASGPLKNAERDSNPSSIFKWMFSANDDNDLGYVLIDPVIHRSSGQPTNVVRLNNGRFAAMVPNGYGSSNGRGVLFFLDVSGRQESGTDMGTWKGGRAIKLSINSEDSENGLMGATWVDIDNNGTADWVYATDLKGNVWKFDITSSNPDDWGSAYKSGDMAVPLFQARSVLPDGTALPLPITTAPVITFPGMGGVMVGFGTGKSIVAGDFPNTKLPQRFYTIWDRGNFAVSVGATTTTRALPTQADLLRRQLVRDAATGNVTLSGDDATTMINWATQDGWYVDFPVTPGQASGSGDMVLSTPVVRSGVLFFTTVWPNGSAEDLCQTAPFSTLYALSPTQGLAVHGLLPTAAAAGVTVTDSKVLVVSDQTVTPETGKDALRIEGRNWELPVSPSSSSGRVQWRVIPGLKTYQ